MKKRILASLMAMLCVVTAGFSSCGLLPKTESVPPEGNSGKNETSQNAPAQNVNQTIGGEETKDEEVKDETEAKDEVIGEDTSSKAEEKNVIKIASNGKKFTKETQEKITIRNVPATKKGIDESRLNVVESFKEFDENKLNVIYDYNDAGEVTSKYYETSNVEDVYAIFDEITKVEGYPYYGLLMLPDTTGMNFFNTTYTLTHRTEKDTRYPNTIDFSLSGVVLTGIIQFEDGREYEIRIQLDNSCTLIYSGFPGYSGNEKSKYLSYDGNTFLTESMIEIPNGSLYTGTDSNSSEELGIYYLTQNAENPYYDVVFKQRDYYSVTMKMRIYDSEKESTNGKLTDEEMSLVVGQVYNLLKDSFVVYDYEYYSQKVNEGAIKK